MLYYVFSYQYISTSIDIKVHILGYWQLIKQVKINILSFLNDWFNYIHNAQHIFLDVQPFDRRQQAKLPVAALWYTFQWQLNVYLRHASTLNSTTKNRFSFCIVVAIYTLCYVWVFGVKVWLVVFLGRMYLKVKYCCHGKSKLKLSKTTLDNETYFQKNVQLSIQYQYLVSVSRMRCNNDNTKKKSTLTYKSDYILSQRMT